MRALMIQSQISEIGAIQDLTSVFESIASLRISQVKDKVTRSTAFFQELWSIYTQLRVDPKARLDSASREVTSTRDAFIVITSQGGLSGDIDQRIVDRTLKDYDPATTDLLVIGSHGVTLLAQRGVYPTKQFNLPEGDEVDVSGIVEEVHRYRHTSVFYERYLSLAQQSVDKIALVSAIQSLSKKGEKEEGETISTRDYVFEPSIEKIIEHMESVMLEIALSQVILESRLAQYASRFNAMNAANKRAGDLRHQLTLDYHRAKRSESDERLKEITTSMETTG